MLFHIIHDYSDSEATIYTQNLHFMLTNMFRSTFFFIASKIKFNSSEFLIKSKTIARVTTRISKIHKNPHSVAETKKKAKPFVKFNF